MLLRGTSSKSKSQLISEIENLGARYNSDSGREISSYSLQVFKQDIPKGVKLLGDIFSNSTIQASELEVLKEEVS